MNKKQTAVIGLFILLIVPIAQAATITGMPSHPINSGGETTTQNSETIEIIGPKNNNLNDPECRSGAPGVTMCKTVFDALEVRIPKAGDDCTKAEGEFSEDMLSFNLDKLPKRGKIELIGGEKIMCFLNDKLILDEEASRRCSKHIRNININKDKFKIGHNALICTVLHTSNTVKRRRAGFKLTHFSYELQTDHSQRIKELDDKINHHRAQIAMYNQAKQGKGSSIEPWQTKKYDKKIAFHTKQKEDAEKEKNTLT